MRDVSLEASKRTLQESIRPLADRPLRILQVIPTYYPAVRYGGPIYAVRSLTRALVALGHHVTVLTTNMDGDGVLDVPLSRPVDLDGARVRYFSAPGPRRLNLSPDMAAALPGELRAADVAHLHSMFSFPTAVGAFLARRAGRPYLLAPRGSLVPELLQRKSRLAKIAWLKLIDRHSLRGAARLHVTTQAEYDDAARLGFPLPPACIVPNGVELPDVGLGEPLSDHVRQATNAGPYVLYVGRISWKKGLDRLLESLVGTKLRLLVAGGDDEGYRPTLEALVAQNDLGRQVHFLGHIDGPDKWWLMHNASCLALTSYNENFGNVVAEAMAAGCPVVVTREVGIQEHVNAAGSGFVVPNDPVLIRKALLELSDNPPLRADKGQRGANYARSVLSWEGAARALVATYREVSVPMSNL